MPKYNTKYQTFPIREDENKGKPVRYVIACPIMRVPMFIQDSVNAYLAFRSIIRSGKFQHNSNKTQHINSFFSSSS